MGSIWIPPPAGGSPSGGHPAHGVLPPAGIPDRITPNVVGLKWGIQKQDSRRANSGNKIRYFRGKVRNMARNCVTLAMTIRPVGISDRISPYTAG